MFTSPPPPVWIVPLEDKAGATYYAFRWNDPITGKMRYHTPKPWVRDRARANVVAEDFARQLPELPARRQLGQTPAAPMTIAAICDEWERLHPHNRTAASAAVQAKRAALHIGVEYPEQLTAKLVEDWRSAHPVGSDRPGAILASVLRWAAKRGCKAQPEAIEELMPPPSSEFDGELMTPEQHAATLERALAFGPSAYALAHCLSLYGWRPAHASRLTIADLSAVRAEVKLPRKDPKPGRKPKKRQPCSLFPETVELLRAITAGRDPSDPIFLTPEGRPWYLDPKGCAVGISQWYRKYIAALAPECGAAYAWKRYAIWAMDAGQPPWPRRLGIGEIQLFTGHETKEQVLRYLRVSEREARGLTTPKVAAGVGTETLQTAEPDGHRRTGTDTKPVILVGPWAKAVPE